MNLNVLSKTRRLASITDFYCNKRVNILFRIKSFSRRIRLHCKLHNQILYGNDNKLIELNKSKLLNDDVDYFKTTQFIIEDLILKSSFLSNHDSILILDILSRIKNPLEKICTNRNVSYLSEEIGNNNESNNIKYGIISRIISRGQTSLLKYLIKSEENMTLTNNERYYLMIALSRDSTVVSFSTWMKLFENVYEALVTKPPDSLYGYKPYEIANLLLIYDQISRWSYKRQNNNNNKVNKKYNTKNIDQQKDNPSEQIKKLEDSNSIGNYDQLNKLDNELELKNIERRTYNPFNLDIINVGISRLEKCIEQLKSEKIIKILYLANSRQCYSNNLFQNSLIYFESEQVLKSFELSEIFTVFNLFSRAYFYHLLRHIESFIYNNNLNEECLDNLIGNNFNSFFGSNFNRLSAKDLNSLIGKDFNRLIGSGIGSSIPTIIGISGCLEKEPFKQLSEDNRVNLFNGVKAKDKDSENTRNDYVDCLDDEMYKFNTSESLCLCTIIISLEYLGRVCKIDKDRFLENKMNSDRIQEIFGEDHQWKDILSFLENRIKNIENVSANITDQTNQEYVKRQGSEFVQKINTFIKINQNLLKLFNIDRKYENKVERVVFCLKLLDSIVLNATHPLSVDYTSNLMINQNNISIESLNKSKLNVETTTI